VCSGDGSQRGGNNQYRKTVGEAKRGDLIVHYRKPHVVAFSRAQENGKFFMQLPLVRGEEYGSGWRFRTEYFELKNRVHRESFTERLMPFRFQHCPINSVGYIRQGYFFPFDLEGLGVVLSDVFEDLPLWLREHRILVDPPEPTHGPSSLRYQETSKSCHIRSSIAIQCTCASGLNPLAEPPRPNGRGLYLPTMLTSLSGEILSQAERPVDRVNEHPANTRALEVCGGAHRGREHSGGLSRLAREGLHPGDWHLPRPSNLWVSEFPARRTWHGSRGASQCRVYWIPN
jgi:hypothetical protein